MKIQWRLVVAALGICTHQAMAQSSVTLYGSLGSSVQYVNNEHGKSLVFMSAGTTPEWVGITGTEDLGDGLKAIFKLENGINTQTGAGLVAADAFSRQAYVGLLSDKYGKVTAGRQFDITNDLLMPISNGYQTVVYQLYHPLNLDDLGSTFYNNAVKYTSPSMLGVTFEAMYGFDDTTTQPGRYAGTGVNYSSGPLKISAVYTTEHDRTLALGGSLGLTNFLGQTLTSTSTFLARSVTTAAIGAMYSVTKDWSVRSMYSEVSVQGFSGNSTTMRTVEAGTNYQTSPFNVVATGAYYSAFAGGRYVAATVSDVYYLSKRTQLFAMIAGQQSRNVPAAMALLAPSSNTRQITAAAGVQLFF